jgi:serine/threonine protein kinase
VAREHWLEAKKILAGALERAQEERHAYLDQACTDPDLRREVESLIAAHEQGDTSFLEQPTIADAALQKGTQLGQFTILARIGSGGMGEVYRAHDSKLKRDVAIKVLPQVFVNDPERLARFQREARLLASLNHPNIASIYGLEDSGKTHALVMELVDGPTLADRIRQGPIPIEETLPIAKQMAEALEYAHEHGIIHRDLKPANVKVTADDTVKILDFGLAKAMETGASAADLSNSPTISQMATEAGVLLGTAAYMSPEQAKGKPVDRRADIWAFGCVLYEMLTGKMAFRGEAVTDTLAAVLKNEPDWSQLPAATPMRLRVLLQRCLQKDPKQRLRDIGDARISLDEVLSGVPDSISSAGEEPVVRAQLVRFEISPPEKSSLTGSFALSPDGRKLAFIAADADGQTRVWVRSLETLKARPLIGTEPADGFPFWSPDSRYIAFPSEGKLKKIEFTGGTPVALCDTSSLLGGTWNRDDKIVLGTPAGLLQASASGGTASPITPVGIFVAPTFLPDGRHLIYWLASSQGGNGPGIYVGSVDANPQEELPKKLLPDCSAVAYAPTSDPAVGRLLFVRGATASGSTGTLMSQSFDIRRLELIGEAIPIADQVSNLGFSTSATDVLVYVTSAQTALAPGARGNVLGQLTWFDREGKVLGRFEEPGSYRALALSPDGKRVVFERTDPKNAGTHNLWLHHFARRVTTRFTFDSSWDTYPVWSPDGRRIAFGSNRDGPWDLYQKASDMAGEVEPLFKSVDHKVPTSWSPDGQFLLYFNPIPPVSVWLLPLGDRGSDRKPIRVERPGARQMFGRFSPDGRWIAYVSDESGKNEIYVRPFDSSYAVGASPAATTSVTGKWMVSRDGGVSPLWRRDGKELFYLGSDGNAMAVNVNTSGVFRAGVPKALFRTPPGVVFWDVSSNGTRFLMGAPTSDSAAGPLIVVLNWTEELKRLVPPGK